jgi:hypothetical protein
MTTQDTEDHAMSDATFSNPVIRWIDYRLPIRWPDQELVRYSRCFRWLSFGGPVVLDR